MYFIRTTKTASGATAVQVIRYQHRQKIVVKHIGSAHTAVELAGLKHIAGDWIKKESRQPPLFSFPQAPPSRLLPLDKCRYLGFRYTLLSEVIHRAFRWFRLDGLPQLLRDLVLIRIAAPASKLESLALLADFFGQDYHRADLYRGIPVFVSLKPGIEKELAAFAKDYLGFDFSIVFYDVTTLYFETFKTDGDNFRQTGFSKDNKPNQPQIIIGLVVTQDGFPVTYEIFPGRVFEGHTFLPMITKFRDAYAVDTLTVVADAAMISLDNINRLKQHRLSYIVGARVAGLPSAVIKQISSHLEHTDGASYRLETRTGPLVCDFSLRRCRKDKREMEKQIQKARQRLAEGKGIKRTKFLKNKNKQKTVQILNTGLIEKTKLILGIKGYYTNLADVDDKTIIAHYHRLWHVEQAFRIAKSDLAIRPVYHFKKQTIEAHVLICFLALAICRYLELKTQQSTKKIVKLLKGVTDARLKNLLTDEEIVLRSPESAEVKQLLKTLWY